MGALFARFLPRQTDDPDLLPENLEEFRMLSGCKRAGRWERAAIVPFVQIDCYASQFPPRKS